MIERLFSAMYVPQNLYCYSIDIKASSAFKRRMRQWAKCFKNVVVTDKEFSVTSAGHNVIKAYLSCMTALKLKKWKYIILLQVYTFVMIEKFKV